jgi:hypothetical protein
MLPDGESKDKVAECKGCAVVDTSELDSHRVVGRGRKKAVRVGAVAQLRTESRVCR